MENAVPKIAVQIYIFASNFKYKKSKVESG